MLRGYLRSAILHCVSNPVAMLFLQFSILIISSKWLLSDVYITVLNVTSYFTKAYETRGHCIKELSR